MNFSWTNVMGSLAAIDLFLLSAMEQILGCKATSGFDAVCSSTALPAQWMLWAGFAFGGLTIIGKLFRPGGPAKSLFGSTAVIVPETSKHSVAGTATPEHVALP